MTLGVVVGKFYPPHRDKVDLYLLTEPDFPFVQDGFRDGESIRDWMHGHFAQQLARGRVPVVRLAGPPAARIEQATAAAEKLLSQPFDL